MQKLNEEIGFMLSLMKRMDEKRNYFDAERLTEDMTKANLRKQVTRDEIFDVMENEAIKGGVKVHLTYVNGKSNKVIKQKVYRGNVNWKQDEMTAALDSHRDAADKDWHKQLSDFNRDNTALKKNPVTNIVAVQGYMFNWTTRDSYRDAYNKYAEGLGNLRMRYGIGLESNGVLGDNHNQRQKIDGGGQFNQNGNLSHDVNLAGAKYDKTIAYLIDDNGDIVDEIPDDVLKAMSKFSNDLEKDVRETLTPEQIEQYKAEKAELAKAFRAQTFNYDGILCIVAKIHNGNYFYYINDKLVPSQIPVNQEAFKEIAEKRLGAACNAIQGFSKP